MIEREYMRGKIVVKIEDMFEKQNAPKAGLTK
jgi:hypothetical protein